MAGYFIGAQLGAAGLPGDIDTVARNPIGSRCQFVDTVSGLQEFVYLKGVASCVLGDSVSFNTSAFVAVRLAPNAAGRVAVAPAAILAANWGWFQIYGHYLTANSDTVAGAGGLFIDTAAGKVDDASVAGNFIFGMLSTAADAAGVLPVNLNYPYVTGGIVPA